MAGILPTRMPMATHRLALLDDYQGVALGMAEWSRLANTDVVAMREHFAGEDALVGALAGFDLLVVMRERTPLPARVLARLPDLRLIVTTGARNASIDVAAAHARGITVCGTGGLKYPTAELTLALMLCLARGIPREQQSLREGRWQAGLGTSLNGRTLGVIGLGTLGSRVARLGAAFEMEVLAWSANLTDERAAAAGARRVDLHTLLAQSDYVTIHLVLSERTRGLIGARELARMQRSAYLVNTSRAPIVDEPALVEALASGRIAGAGIDVYSDEPLPADAPILRAPNTVLTPHIGYVVEEGYRVFYGDALEDVEAFLAGAPVRVITG
jgi:phosphoglycerate dehydrogenase-like enzyme